LTAIAINKNCRVFETRAPPAIRLLSAARLVLKLMIERDAHSPGVATACGAGTAAVVGDGAGLNGIDHHDRSPRLRDVCRDPA
jgi:hypothetical protein